MRRIVMCIVSVVVLALGSSLAADEMNPQTPPNPEPPTTTISGTVVSSSGHTLVIDTDAGNRMTFDVASTSLLPARMAPGARVQVEYHPGESGVNQVAKVTTLETGMHRHGLPRTASPLPFIGLIGLGCLGAAALLRTSLRTSV